MTPAAVGKIEKKWALRPAGTWPVDGGGCYESGFSLILVGFVLGWERVGTVNEK